jgi:monoamine oxidase
VSASWTDTKTSLAGETLADWMVCMIPAHVLGQIGLQVSGAKKVALRALPGDKSIWSGGEVKRCFLCANLNILKVKITYKVILCRLSEFRRFYRKSGRGDRRLSVRRGGLFILAGIMRELRAEAAGNQGAALHSLHSRAEFLPGAWLHGVTGCGS